MDYDDTQTPVIEAELVREYHKAIEKTVGNVDRVFLLLDELMVLGKAQSDPAIIGKEFEDEIEREYQRLILVTTLIGVANQTETIRLALVSITDHIKESSVVMANEIEKAEEHFNKILAKVRAGRKEVSKSPPMYAKPKKGSQPRKTKKEQLADLMLKENVERSVRNIRIRLAKETYYFNLRRYTPRTMPIGTDYFGNTYWHFQQKTMEAKEWGWWIIVEKSTVMPNSLQESVKKEEDLESEVQSQTPTKGGNKRKRANLVQASGDIYYLPIEKPELEGAITWLEYQEKLYQSFQAGSRKNKMLYTDSDADKSCPNVIKYLKQLVNMCDAERAKVI